MRTLAGRDAHIYFTALSTSSSAALADVFDNPTTPSNSGTSAADHLDALTTRRKTSEPHAFANASAHREGVLELMKQNNIPLERVCLLDPKAEKELSPEDGNGTFDYFLFGVSAYFQRDFFRGD